MRDDLKVMFGTIAFIIFFAVTITFLIIDADRMKNEDVRLYEEFGCDDFEGMYDACLETWKDRHCKELIIKNSDFCEVFKNEL